MSVSVMKMRESQEIGGRSAGGLCVASEGGFSLVELLLSLMILSMVITAVVVVLVGAQARGIEAQHEAAATAAAQQQVEAKRAVDFSTLSDGTTSFTPSGVPRVVTANVVTSTTNADLKQVVVTVTWNEGS